MEFKSKVDQLMYKMAYDFEMKHCSGCTEIAHQKGLKKIKSIHEIAEEEKNVQWTDITTGKTVQYGGW
jgi:hypothetical protein